MNNYLKSAAKRYPQEKGVMINPISELDAKIFWQILIMFERHGIDSVTEILGQYKYLADVEILKLLEDWNKNNSPNTQEDEEGNQEGSLAELFDVRRKFIDFEGGLLEVYGIKRVDKDDFYNYKETRMEYRIIINKDIIPYANTVYSYNSPELRDEKLELLKDMLGEEIDIIGE